MKKNNFCDPKELPDTKSYLKNNSDSIIYSLNLKEKNYTHLTHVIRICQQTQHPLHHKVLWLAPVTSNGTKNCHPDSKFMNTLTYI